MAFRGRKMLAVTGMKIYKVTVISPLGLGLSLKIKNAVFG